MNSRLRRPGKWAHGSVALTLAFLVLSVAGCGGAEPSTPTAASSAQATPTPAAESTQGVPPEGSPGAGSTDALDTSFGDHGRVLTDIDGRSDEAQGVVVQPDGKIVALGETWVFPQDRPRFALVRYNPDGSLDTSFGEGGKVVTGMTDDEWDYSIPHALALQPDGKLLAAGTSYSSDANHNVFAVARFNAGGSLDTSFGDGGRVLTPIDTTQEAGDEEADALALATDGKIVLAGTKGVFPADFAAVRYLPDGSLDTSFSDGGKISTDLGGDDKASAVVVQPDGKVVVAGRGVDNAGDWAMLRYLPDGKLDRSFGDKGKVSLDFKGGEDYATGILLQEGGKILLGGDVHTGMVLCPTSDNYTRACDKFGFGLARYTSDGKPDGSFGEGGKAIYEFDLTSGARAMSAQPDGKIVMAGHFDNDDFAAVRANADGSLDTSFGDAGMIRTAFGRGMDVANAVALQSDGKLILAGTASLKDEDVLNGDFALTRYNFK